MNAQREPLSTWGARKIARSVPLAPLTTLGLGGSARYFTSVTTIADLVQALTWAKQAGVPVFVLGGGSNLVIADTGFDGLVIHIGLRGVRRAGDDGLEAAAGEPWDALVEAASAAGLSGIECLSGIPGQVGATPIQNVGAYGQEVASTIESVEVFDRNDDRLKRIPVHACDFGYRTSLFKQDPDRFVIVAVRFRLVPGGRPVISYAELARALADVPHAGPMDVRAAVLALRRGKSMVIEPGDENRRSVGSFFLNPIVDAAVAESVITRALVLGVARRREDVPVFPAPLGKVKLAAGWLIEKSGFARGYRQGNVGLSSRHALALVHYGGGSAQALIDLARTIRDGVAARFGVVLTPEARLVGLSL